MPEGFWPRQQRSPLRTDPDSPSATTATGRNPWPAIWAAELLAGHADLHPDAATAGRNWLARHGKAVEVEGIY